jgi:hypothetical protein
MVFLPVILMVRTTVPVVFEQTQNAWLCGFALSLALWFDPKQEASKPKAKQDKDKTGQDKTRQDKTKTIQYNTRQDETIQDKIRQAKTR